MGKLVSWLSRASCRPVCGKSPESQRRTQRKNDALVSRTVSGYLSVVRKPLQCPRQRRTGGSRVETRTMPLGAQEYKESERHSMTMRRCRKHALVSLEYKEPERHSRTMRRSESHLPPKSWKRQRPLEVVSLASAFLVYPCPSIFEALLVVDGAQKRGSKSTATCATECENYRGFQ